jgi:HlyD family secretion protein
MKKRIIVFLLIIISIGAAAYFIKAKNDAPILAEGITVEEGKYEEVISGIGYVEYEKEVVVRSEVGGKILTMPKTVSDRVEENELLMSIDDQDARLLYDDLAIAVELSKARLSDYKSAYYTSSSNVTKQEDIIVSEIEGLNLSLAQLENDIVNKTLLVNEGIVPQEELSILLENKDTLLQSIETLKVRQSAITKPSYTDKELSTAIEVAEKNRLQQEEALNKYQVISPIKGLIIESYAKEGELIQIGQDIMKIAADDKKYVIVDIDEKYLGDLKAGNEASLVLEQYPQEVIKGVINKTAPLINKETGTIEVKVEVLDKKDYFLQNMTVRVDFSTVSFDNAILIPGSYLVDEEELKVFILNQDQIVEERKVMVYNQNVASVYVTSGLNQGDIVLNPKDLEAGMIVDATIKGAE